MMLDTIDLLAELAQQCASHTHPGTGAPVSASAYTQVAARAGQTCSKYQKIIVCSQPAQCGLFYTLAPDATQRAVSPWRIIQ